MSELIRKVTLQRQAKLMDARKVAKLWRERLGHFERENPQAPLMGEYRRLASYYEAKAEFIRQGVLRAEAGDISPMGAFIQAAEAQAA